MLQTVIFQASHSLRYLLFFLVSAVLISTVLAEPSQHDTEKKLAKVQEQIRKSQRKLEKQRGDLGNLEKQLRESEQSIGNLNQQLARTEASLKKNQAKINELQLEEKQLQKQLSKHHDILYAQIRSEYQYGGQQKLSKHPTLKKLNLPAILSFAHPEVSTPIYLSLIKINEQKI